MDQDSAHMVACDGLGEYDWSDHVKEGPNYALMAFSSSNFSSEVSSNSICSKSCLETVNHLKSQNDQLLKNLKKSKLMVLVMSLSPHSTIVPLDSDNENTFSYTNILNYFSALPGSISLDSSNDFTKHHLDILVFSPLHDDSKIEVIQAYDVIPPPQVVIALPAILPPSPVLSLSLMFDSQYLFPSKEISPKDTETPVESPIPVPLSSLEGSSSPVKSTTPDYLFDESIFVELDNSLWIISRPLESNQSSRILTSQILLRIITFGNNHRRYPSLSSKVFRTRSKNSRENHHIRSASFSTF
nr:hypothetical protein [Tanacetum cinerariifolium]